MGLVFVLYICPTRLFSATAELPDSHFQVPDWWVPSEDNVHRTDLYPEIEERLGTQDHQSTGRKVVVLLGMGGQGKSHLALDYCYKNRQSGKYHAILWVDGSSSRSISRDYNKIVSRLGLALPVHCDDKTKIDAIQKALGSRTMPWLLVIQKALGSRKMPWLLVIDGYDNPEKFNIYTYLPEGDTAKVLITSRHSYTAEFLLASKLVT